jgi:hypothetical protein
MSGIRRSNWLVPTPKSYVKTVLAKIGTSGGAGWRPYSATLWPGHALADWAITNLLPSENWLLNYQYSESAAPIHAAMLLRCETALTTRLAQLRRSTCADAHCARRRDRPRRNKRRPSAHQLCFVCSCSLYLASSFTLDAAQSSGSGSRISISFARARGNTVGQGRRTATGGEGGNRRQKGGERRRQ